MDTDNRVYGRDSPIVYKGHHDWDNERPNGHVRWRKREARRAKRRASKLELRTEALEYLDAQVEDALEIARYDFELGEYCPSSFEQTLDNWDRISKSREPDEFVDCLCVGLCRCGLSLDMIYEEFDSWEMDFYGAQ